jgi:dihydrofolate reductase
MRKVILQEFVSLDGRASGPNDSTDFVPASTQGDQSFGDWQTAFLDTLDTMLMGRVTYELFASFWPNVTSGEDKPFADKLNAIPRVVFSSTLERAPWGKFEDARVVHGNASDEVAKLRQQSGKDMVIWGSLSLARSLMKDGQIDEVQMVMCPLVLGEGKALFHDRIDPGGLKLLKTRSFDRGTVLLAYAPAGVS